ncbi:MAG: flagellar protein FliT [Lachnospiraceae bacterium]|nr:flagellar protein FliT [Lachnospiraceae bacterium]
MERREMMVESEYIRIMTESLEKKRDILGKVIELNKQQKFLLQDPNLSPEQFEENMQYKANLVDQLNLLDSGFEKLFNRVRDALNNNRDLYTSEIRRMQELIKDITALLNTVQTQEVRNREEVTRKFASVREQVKGVRNSQKVVNQYYQNMMKRGNVAPQFFDNKK